MPYDDERYMTPKWRTLWLAVGFAALVGISIVTVLKPALEDEPAQANSAKMQASETPPSDVPSQE